MFITEKKIHAYKIEKDSPPLGTPSPHAGVASGSLPAIACSIRRWQAGRPVGLRDASLADYLFLFLVIGNFTRFDKMI